MIGHCNWYCHLKILGDWATWLILQLKDTGWLGNVTDIAIKRYRVIGHCDWYCHLKIKGDWALWIILSFKGTGWMGTTTDTLLKSWHALSSPNRCNLTLRLPTTLPPSGLHKEQLKENKLEDTQTHTHAHKAARPNTHKDFIFLAIIIADPSWPRCLRRRSAVARLLGLWVRIPLGGMDVCLLWVLCVVR